MSADTRKPPYPANWPEISKAIKARAKGRCECMGECGLHQPKTIIDHECALIGEPRRCIEEHGKRATYARGKIMFTVHHLDFNPANNQRSNLRAMCQRCHLRCDGPLHKMRRAITIDRKKGQLTLGHFMHNPKGELSFQPLGKPKLTCKQLRRIADKLERTSELYPNPYRGLPPR